MSVGFRKSIFGFNCDDVMEYIESTHKTYADKEIVLNEKIESLKDNLKDMSAELGELRSTKANLENQLKEYTEKYDEIERLSQNIGKLYLVAQANARAIMKTSEESVQISRDEVARNLSSIGEAHNSLNNLKEQIIKTSDDFTAKVENLIASLDSTREQISENSEKLSNSENAFAALYAEMEK